MDITQATTLSDFVDTKEFLENSLDVYESYTYNLEWFVVDIDADRKFQEFGETLSVVSVVNDGWPGVGDTKITIAKTGVTTEFNITDLTIEGSGAGIAETSKIAGTALTLDFTVTEVGETSLVDNLQNAIALTGWKSIDQTHFYMKINFVGFDVNGKNHKISQTKVLTFTLQRVTNLQSQTDARGTTTVLRGTILQDSVIGNKLSISKTENGFTYIVGETLEDTLGIVSEVAPEPKEGSFIDELNKSIKDAHPNLLPNLQNTYKITMSDQFKTLIKGTSMRGITSSTIENMSPPIASQVGQVPALMNIYSIINDICLNAIKIKEELTKDNKKLSKVHKITPWLIPKTGGWNAVTGTMAYNVEFFIDYEKKFISQHPLDAAAKAANINKTIEELFAEFHVNKMYNYLFTGKNDQIIDFNITLDSYLAKVYSAPTDWYAYENILKAGTIEGNELIDGFRKSYETAAEVEKDILSFQRKHSKMLESATANLKNYDDSLRTDLLDAYAATLAMGYGEAAPKKMAETFFKGKSNEEIMSAVSKLDSNYMEMANLSLRFINRKKLEEQSETAQSRYNKITSKLTAHQKSRNTLYGDFIASSASVSGEENWKNGVKQNAQKMLSGVKNKNPKNMILLEELDNDIISKMSNEDFESILRSQANNPVVYKTLISTLSKNKSAVTMKPTDVEGVELARAKYYESKTNDVSMIKAQMTIKGDPHWLDGYMPPSVAKKEFGDVGAVSEKGYSMQTTSNGYNYLILKSGVADGTDLYDNVLKRNLITYLYCVNNVTSNFNGGIFTQILTMTRVTDADDLSTIVANVGPTPTEKGDKGAAKTKAKVEVKDKYTQIMDEQQNYEIVLQEYGVANNQNTYITSDGVVRDALGGPVEVTSGLDRHGSLEGEPWDPLSGSTHDAMLQKIADEKAVKVAFDRHKNIEQYNDRLQDTTDDVVISNNIATLGQHAAPLLDNVVRKNLADDFLDDTYELSEACNSGDAPSCTGLSESRNKILETFGHTIEDAGKPATITSINTQLNTAISTANPDFIISSKEIAMYQIAAGGELNIDGHNSVEQKLDIAKIVEDTTGIRTTEVILANSDKPLGANKENKLLNGGDLLVDVETPTTLINVPAYTWSKEKYNNQIMHPNSNGPMDFNDMPQTWFKQKVDSTVIKTKPRDAAMLKLRTLEVVGIADNTLTNSELADVTILSDGINDILLKDDHYSDLLAKKSLWIDDAFAVLDQEISEKGLIVSDDDKTALKTSIVTQVHQSTSLDALEENDYLTVKKYENEINKINAAAYGDGHRGDVTRAVQIGMIQGEILALGAKHDAITATPYYFDPSRRLDDIVTLTELENDLAMKILAQPPETITQIATIDVAGDITEVPVFTQVETFDETKTPLILGNTSLTSDTYDIAFPGTTTIELSDIDLVVTDNKRHQYITAHKINSQILSYSIGGPWTTVTDAAGVEISVKDFSNLAPIVYVDADGISQTIVNPSFIFGLTTPTLADIEAHSNEFSQGHYINVNQENLLRQKIAALFPDIGTTDPNKDSKGFMARWLAGEPIGTITLSNDSFYIKE